MLGYDISWSAFNIIEVMSSNKFTFKVRNHEIFLSIDLLLFNFDTEKNEDINQLRIESLIRTQIRPMIYFRIAFYLKTKFV